MSKDTLIVHREQFDALLELKTLDDVRSILLAMVEYGMDGQPPDIPAHLQFGWVGFRHVIDYDNAKYASVVEKRRAAALKRWQSNADNANASISKQSNADDANASISKQSNADDANVSISKQSNALDTDTDTDTDKENELSLCSAIDQLIELYPRVEYPEIARRELALAVTRKAQSMGLNKLLAFQMIRGKTELFIKAKSSLPKNQQRFIPDAARWFRDGGFDADPKHWGLMTETVDPRNPETWQNDGE